MIRSTQFAKALTALLLAATAFFFGASKSACASADGGAKLEDQGRPQLLEVVLRGKPARFLRLPALSLTISSSCARDGRVGRCKAASALGKADLSRLPEDPFGRNPGAMLCSHQLGGSVAWARDANGNERTFCLFTDGSAVATSSLAHYGAKQRAPASSEKDD